MLTIEHTSALRTCVPCIAGWQRRGFLRKGWVPSHCQLAYRWFVRYLTRGLKVKPLVDKDSCTHGSKLFPLVLVQVFHFAFTRKKKAGRKKNKARDAKLDEGHRESPLGWEVQTRNFGRCHFPQRNCNNEYVQLFLNNQLLTRQKSKNSSMRTSCHTSCSMDHLEPEKLPPYWLAPERCTARIFVQWSLR